MKEEDTFFHPESVDEEIEQAGLPVEKQAEPSKHPSPPHNEGKEQLVIGLRDIYQQDASTNEHDLDVAWQQIQASDQYQKRFGQKPTKWKEHTINMQGLQPKTAGQNVRRRREAPAPKESNFKRTLSRLAAVLIIGAIVGSMALVIHAARNRTTVGLGPAISGKVIFTYHDTSADQVIGVSWSKDSSRLLSVGGSVQIWDINNNKFAHFTSSNHTAPYSATWSPDGQFIAAYTDHGIEVVDATTGNVVRTCSTPFQHSSAPSQEQPLAQNTTLNAVPLTSSLALQSLDSGPTGNTLYTDWSPDGKYLAATIGDPASGAAKVFVYNSNCNVVFFWQPGELPTPQVISDVAWSPDGKYLAWSVDSRVEIWDFAKHQRFYTYSGASAGATFDSVRWSPDSQRIITVDSLNHIAIWDALTGKHKTSYYNQKISVKGVAWSPDSHYTVIAGNLANGDGTTFVLDTQTGKTIYTSPDHKTTFAVDWSPDGRYIAVAHGLPINPAANTLPLRPGQGKATVSIIAAW